jgi:hypothetical protein
MAQEPSTDANRSEQTQRTETRPHRRRQVESFRELAQRIQTDESEQRFEDALRTILNAKTPPKNGK